MEQTVTLMVGTSTNTTVSYSRKFSLGIIPLQWPCGSIEPLCCCIQRRRTCDRRKGTWACAPRDAASHTHFLWKPQAPADTCTQIRAPYTLDICWLLQHTNTEDRGQFLFLSFLQFYTAVPECDASDWTTSTTGKEFTFFSLVWSTANLL